MVSYYCQYCDSHINQKCKQKHLKSKTHINMYNNIVINKHFIGDVYWDDIERIIQKYIIDNRSKFRDFTILVRCKLNDENINISVNGHKGCVPLYKFEDGT